MSHRYHPDPDRNDPPTALLWDDCERCDEQAADPRGLDHVKVAEAWRRMRQVELHRYANRNARYLTANERRLGSYLYAMYVLVEHLGGVDARGRIGAEVSG